MDDDDFDLFDLVYRGLDSIDEDLVVDHRMTEADAAALIAEVALEWYRDMKNGALAKPKLSVVAGGLAGDGAGDA